MDIEFSIIAGLVLPLYPLLFAIYQKIGRYDEIVEEFKKLRDEHQNYRERTMERKTDTAPEDDRVPRPVARVTGLYRGTFGACPAHRKNPADAGPGAPEPDLLRTRPESRVCRRKPHYRPRLRQPFTAPGCPDLFRGTDIPRGIRFWPDWFTIPPYDEMHDLDGRRVYPRAPGIHTVQVRTACRKFAHGPGPGFLPEMAAPRARSLRL